MGTRPGACPACERFIGPLDTCPYCDCPAERQATMRFLRIAAIVVAIGGLAILAIGSLNRQTPTVRVSAIGPSMNFARVCVIGAIDSPPRAGNARSGDRWFGCSLNDGTGEIRLSAYGHTAESLFSTMTATAGASYRVEGWLTVKAGKQPSLQIRDPSHVVRLEDHP